MKMKVLLIISLLAVQISFAYDGIGYNNNKLIGVEADVRAENIGGLVFDNCNWNFIRNELYRIDSINKHIFHSQSRYLFEIHINNSDTVDVDYLSEIIKNNYKLSIDSPKLIIATKPIYPRVKSLILTLNVFDSVSTPFLLGKFSDVAILVFSVKNGFTQYEFNTLIEVLTTKIKNISDLSIYDIHSLTIPDNTNNLEFLTSITFTGEGELNGIEFLEYSKNLERICIKGFESLDTNLILDILMRMSNLKLFVCDCFIKERLIKSINEDKLNKKNKIKIDCY